MIAFSHFQGDTIPIFIDGLNDNINDVADL
jgi:hypothetical protein